MQDNHHGLSWQILGFAFIVFFFLYATSQLSTPYIRHDDFDFLMPKGWNGGYSTPWEKTLTEGRWISYLWYGASQHLTPKSSYLLYITAYFVMSCAVAHHISAPRTFLLCGLALFFSPMFGDLSLWPTGMFISVAIGSLSTLAILLAKKSHILPVIFISTSLLILTYPPIASIVLLAATIKTAESQIKFKAALAFTYVFAFAIGSLAIYFLNYFEHGHFGVKIDTWRHPHPLRSITDAVANIALYFGSWSTLLRLHAIPIVCGVVASIAAIGRPETRRMATSILLAALLICGIELGIVLITGTPIPSRSYVWLWLAICALCAQTAMSDHTLCKTTGLILLSLLSIYGMHSWWNLYRQKQPIAAYQEELAIWIHQYQAITGIPYVEVVGDPRRTAELRSMDAPNVMPALTMSMLKRYDIKLEECTASFCNEVQQYLATHENQVSPLLALNGKLALIFDINNKSIHQLNVIQRDYPGEFEETELKLGYRIFLRYSSDSAQITPFFPGSSKRPVSVMLEPVQKGYLIRKGKSTCTYPLFFNLKSLTGQQLASGIYSGSTPIVLNGWGKNIGSAILAVSMAEGSKNNYGCNIVITKIK
ncbi:hypothetical protein [Frateuria sp. Soil773]|uniref:hypothetical protein n=1 Tax=Frateuria sp. Soil773 TaxID=1736407 RepID=UPI0012FA83C9|nr:hypothetical protein [Frateuria sp. Soil773]